MKAQPLAYNKDNQEDKEPLFDTVDTLSDTLRIYADMLAGIQVNSGMMREAATRGYATATDLADYLVKKGMPFREAHEAVAQAVRHAAESGRDLSAFALSELRKFSRLIDDDIFAVLTLEGSINSRNHIGGTSPEQTRAAIRRAREWLDSWSKQ
jgi:argininosuccinate lyase